AGSSPRPPTWRASLCVTSVSTTNPRPPSNGPTATSHTESSLLPIQLLQATSIGKVDRSFGGSDDRRRAALLCRRSRTPSGPYPDGIMLRVPPPADLSQRTAS